MQEIPTPRTLKKLLLFTKGSRWQLPCVSFMVCTLLVSIVNAQTLNNNSPIWGSSNENVIGIPLDVDDPASVPPPPPPDDPADVPIDGSIGILLIVSIGIGYKNRRTKV